MRRDIFLRNLPECLFWSYSSSSLYHNRTIYVRKQTIPAQFIIVSNCASTVHRSGIKAGVYEVSCVTKTECFHTWLFFSTRPGILKHRHNEMNVDDALLHHFFDRAAHATTRHLYV